MKQKSRVANNRINFKGIDIKPRLSRHYPQGEIFSHALGYVGLYQVEIILGSTLVFILVKSKLGKHQLREIMSPI
ncbi:MAG: hypothetical protein Ct9H300mP4_16770 [Gammaproteobacteria bacterium]|nr:MAG: hypothetical protein Ct9H300mP4_16770 [Gammaproteobacteria bacterium]